MFHFLKAYPLARRFMVGRFLSAFADQFLLFAVPLLVFQTTGSVSKSGLSFFIEWLPRVVSLPVATLFVTKWGRVRVLYLADCIRATSLGIAVCLLHWIAQADWFWILAVTSGMCSFLAAQSFIALESTFPTTINSKDLPKGQALLQLSEQVATLCGPVLAGILAGLLPKDRLLLVAGLFFAIASINTFLLRQKLPPPYPGASNKTESWSSRFLAGVKIVGQDPRLIAMVLVALCLNLIIGAVMTLNPSVLTGKYHLTDLLYGQASAVVGMFSVLALGSIPRLTERWPLSSIGATSLAIIALAILVMGAGLGPVIHIVCFGFIMSGTMVFNVYMRTTRAIVVQTKYSPSLLPSVIATMVFCNQLALPVVGLWIGYLGKSYSPISILMMLGCLSVIGIVTSGIRLFFAERALFRARESSVSSGA